MNEKLRELDLELGKKIIHSMNKNLKLAQYKNVDGIHYHLISSTELMAIVKDLINTPKNETVEEWEERTGESYPEDAPVWVWNAEAFSDCGDWAPRLWEDFSPDRSCYVANYHGKPEIEE